MSLDSGTRSQIESLAKAGNLIEAIKLYREKTGCSLSQAKNEVEAIARGEEPRDSSIAASSPSSGVSMEEIQSALARGNKIEAIKLYRNAHNVDLATAKAAVEALANNASSSSQNQLPGVQKSGCFGLLMLGGVMGILIAHELLT